MMHKLRVETPNDMQCPWKELGVSIIISMNSEKQGI